MVEPTTSSAGSGASTLRSASESACSNTRFWCSRAQPCGRGQHRVGEPRRVTREGDEDAVEAQAERSPRRAVADRLHAPDRGRRDHAVGEAGGARQRVRAAGGPADDGEPIDAERVGETGDVVGPPGHRSPLRSGRFADPGAVDRDHSDARRDRPGHGERRVGAAAEPAVAPDHRRAGPITELRPREGAPVRNLDEPRFHTASVHPVGRTVSGSARIMSCVRAISSAGERCLHTAEVTGSKPVSPTDDGAGHGDCQMSPPRAADSYTDRLA